MGTRPDALEDPETEALRETSDLQDLQDQMETSVSLDSQGPRVPTSAKETVASKVRQERLEWWGPPEPGAARGPQVSLDNQGPMDLLDLQAALDFQVLLVLWDFTVWTDSRE